MATFILELTLLFLAVIGAGGSDAPIAKSGECAHSNLMQLIFEERLQRRLVEEKVRVLEESVQELLSSNRVLQAKMINTTDEIRNNNKQVAFSGKVGKFMPLSKKGQIVKFEGVTTNIGEAYSAATGIFRCPVSGLYLYTCHILGDTPGIAVVTIYQNGKIIARPHTGVSNAKGHDTGSDAAIVHAEAGDEIYVKLSGGDSKNLDHMSRCSGALLKTD